MDQSLYQQVKTNIQKILNINLDYYKDEQMRRRLDSWLARSGAENWDAYFARIRQDEVELARFRDFLTINVTEFFRDIERWNYLKSHVLPDLLKALPISRPGGNALRIWSAGCSIGAEPFSLAMMLEEISNGKSHYLLGTDLDRGALAKAKTGGPFTQEEIQNITPGQKSAYFKPGGPPYYVNSKVIQKITFREQNMITDQFENNFDLVVCRNVVIYFTNATKEILYKKFSNSLRPGGVLFVGGTEIIPRPQDFNLKGFGFSFYVKQ